jgi:lipopolysaccharide/colanic/teichoic acid biosynthesis glycosyltransferase
MKRSKLRGSARSSLIDELYIRYAKAQGWRKRFTYYRKKYAWILVVAGAKFIKRFIDIVVSLFLLIALLPLFLVIVLLIKLTDGGPVFFVADRVGKWGKEFRFPKFRTMVMGAHAQRSNLRIQSDLGTNSVTFKMKKDPRVTWIGRILRKTSFDELPQLWCVLVGDMTLVGPRPPLPEEVALYHLEQRKRLDVVPGLTCIWQVSGRSEIPFPHQVKLDLQYIESQSLWLDLVILFKTIPAVIFGRGAY